MAAQVYRPSSLPHTGESCLQHSLNEPECVGIFINADLLPVVAKLVAEVPSLRVAIYDGQPSESVLSKIKGSREGVTSFLMPYANSAVSYPPNLRNAAFRLAMM
jgi:hypothetical protein